MRHPIYKNFVFFLLFFFPFQALACMGPLHYPKGACYVDSGSQFYKVNETFLKIPNKFLLHKEPQFKRRFSGRTQTFDVGHASPILHAMLPDFGATCESSYISSDVKESNIYSSYHYPILFRSSCTGTIKAAEYDQNLIRDLVELKIGTLQRLGEKSNINVVELLKANILNKQRIYLRESKFYNNTVLELEDFHIVHKKAFLNSRYNNKKRHNQDRIDWSPTEKILIIARNLDEKPISIECYYKSLDPKTYGEKNTLGRYEFCDVSFIYGENKFSVIARVNGNRIPFDGRSVGVVPLIEKFSSFISAFEKEKDHPDITAEISAQKSEVESNLVSLENPRRFWQVMYFGRLDLLKKMLDRGDDPNEFGTVRGILNHANPDEKREYLNVLFEGGLRLEGKNAPVCSKDKRHCDRESLICKAAMEGASEIMMLLINNGMTIEQNHTGREHRGFVKSFFPDTRNPFLCAVQDPRKYNRKVFQLLFDAGADPYIRGKNDLTLLDLVSPKYKSDFLDFIKSNNLSQDFFQHDVSEATNLIKSWETRYRNIAYLPKEYIDDPAIVREALINRFILNLGYFPSKMGDNKNVVLDMLAFYASKEGYSHLNKMKPDGSLWGLDKQENRSIYHISDRLKKDPEVIRLMVAVPNYLFKYEYRDDGKVYLKEHIKVDEFTEAFGFDIGLLNAAVADLKKHYPLDMSTPNLSKDDLRFLVSTQWNRLDDLGQKEVWQNDVDLATYMYKSKEEHLSHFSDWVKQAVLE